MLSVITFTYLAVGQINMYLPNHKKFILNILLAQDFIIHVLILYAVLLVPYRFGDPFVDLLKEHRSRQPHPFPEINRLLEFLIPL